MPQEPTMRVKLDRSAPEKIAVYDAAMMAVHGCVGYMLEGCYVHSTASNPWPLLWSASGHVDGQVSPEQRKKAHGYPSWSDRIPLLIPEEVAQFDALSIEELEAALLMLRGAYADPHDAFRKQPVIACAMTAALMGRYIARARQA